MVVVAMLHTLWFLLPLWSARVEMAQGMCVWVLGFAWLARLGPEGFRCHVAASVAFTLHNF
eukprot:13037087-Alexandrium_andersonii.AAC.1